MTIREVIKDMNITNKYDYRIGFINADGQEDETEYETFCEDNGFSKDTVIYIDLVARTKMEMNIGYLKDVIKDLPDDMPVFVACQGECNYDFYRKQPCKETDTFGIVYDGKLFITDECAVETGNGTL